MARLPGAHPSSTKSIASAGVDERYRLVMHPFSRTFVMAWIATVMSVAAGGARAASVFDTVGLLPATAETVVVVHDGATMRRSAVGRAAIDAVTQLVGFGETGRAWQTVSAALEMGPDEAFDALLGERMAFASREDEADKKHWVLVSQIRDDVRQRMLRALKTAPREVIEGAVVLGIEDGAYAMVLLERAEGTLVIIGPGGRDPMVVEVVRSLRKAGAAALASGPELALMRQLGTGGHANLLALVRHKSDDGAWTGFVGVARDDALVANFRVEMPGLAHVPVENTVWTRATFNKLSEGALAAAVDISGPMDVTGPAADLLLPMGISDAMKAVMGSRVAMVIRPGMHGPIEAAISIETTDTTAMARAGDRWIDQMLSGLPVGSGGHQLRANQFVSMPPTASRAIDLSRQVPAMRDNGWNAGPMVAWNSRIEIEDCNPGQHQGWWTVGVGTGTVGALSTLMAARTPDAVAIPWVSMGVARPEALLKAAATLGWTVPEALQPIGRVHEVSWEAMRTRRPTEMVGRLRVEVRADPAPAAQE